MVPLIQILALVSFGSILSLAAGLALLSRGKLLERAHLYLVAFAAGALIGTALFDLLPEALENAKAQGVDGDGPFVFMALGIALFFLLEKFLHWYHDHVGHGPGRRITKSVVPLITVSDGLHNFIDGAIIAAATLTDTRLGALAALAVFLHEMPQEVGDFSVLIFGGLSRAKAILYNVSSAAMAYVGALATILVSERLEALAISLVAFTAGAFTFIALGELVPELVHKEKSGLKTALLAATFVLAIFFVRQLGLMLDAAFARP